MIIMMALFGMVLLFDNNDGTVWRVTIICVPIMKYPMDELNESQTLAPHQEIGL